MCARLTAESRQAPFAMWRAALGAGDVDPLLQRQLRLSGHRLAAGPLSLDLDRMRRVLVLGAGKAGASMARAGQSIHGGRVRGRFDVVQAGYQLPAARLASAERGNADSGCRQVDPW